MTAREYLSRLEKIELEIKQKEEERRELLERATSITASFGSVKVQTSPKYDRMAEFVGKAADMEGEIALMVISLWEERNRIVNQIHALNTPRHITILYERYVQHKKLDKIAEEMGYSDQYIRELHGKALKEFEKNPCRHFEVKGADSYGKNGQI